MAKCSQAGSFCGLEIHPPIPLQSWKPTAGSSSAAAGFAMLLALVPWILMIVFAVRASQRGESRTALGIGVGFASILGVGLLLVAACFGLLSNANFH